jgi:hypothetical protein
MVHAFRFRLDYKLAQLSVPPGILQEIKADEIRLAALQIPTGLDTRMQASIKQSIGEAFVFGFRIILLVCAGLSVVGAALAALMMPKAAIHSGVRI